MISTPGHAARDARFPLTPFSFERRAPGPNDVKYRFVIDLATLKQAA